MRKQVMILTAASMMVFGMTNYVEAAKKVLLKVPVAYGTHLPGLGSPILKVADDLKKVSGGQMRMKVYEPGKLVAPFEILDAVSTGKTSAGYAMSGYWAGKMPAAPLFSAVPFGPEAGEYLAWIFKGNGLKLYQEMYDQGGYNVKVIPCGIIAPETSGWFAKPIDKPEDLKGLRMRFFGLGAKVMERLGVSTSLLPGGEVFPALEKGAIDAAEFSLPAVDKRLGFHKVVKYNYFPGWHQQASFSELLINKKVWNKMDEAQQQTLEVVCKASLTNSLAEAEHDQFAAMQENISKNGVKIRYWSNEMLDTFRAAWDEVVVEQKKDPFFAKVWQDLSTFRDGYKLWKVNGFLPRR
uniref:Putative extracellular solute-binding protein, family 7/putative TRAP-type C4-dicarboxylate transport system, periplasmic component n=1 Tax=Magnetococcus massalia (strain MO-1) TaxID=451514 RepID=A0A1S7LCB9_MAGMO|nr:Putative extracellular solute-binding protein, family 7/putative TRAP-type C4-dicarboxylate transport system, periplasmic component [Candidatus Magnetococcus massalia]